MPITPINETKSSITVLKPQAPQSQLGKQAAEVVKSSTLDKVDTYVRTTNRMEGAVLGLVNSYYNTQAAMSGGRVATDYVNVLNSMKRAGTQRAVTSGVRNGISVIMKKETLPEAGGNVVGDVSAAAIVAGTSSAATNLAVFALSKTGLSSFPVLIGGMAASYVTDRLTAKALIKFNVQQTITNKATELFEKIGGGNEEAAVSKQ